MYLSPCQVEVTRPVIVQGWAPSLAVSHELLPFRKPLFWASCWPVDIFGSQQCTVPSPHDILHLGIRWLSGGLKARDPSPYGLIGSQLWFLGLRNGADDLVSKLGFFRKESLILRHVVVVNGPKTCVLASFHGTQGHYGPRSRSNRLERNQFRFIKFIGGVWVEIFPQVSWDGPFDS